MVYGKYNGWWKKKVLSNGAHLSFKRVQRLYKENWKTQKKLWEFLGN